MGGPRKQQNPPPFPKKEKRNKNFDGFRRYHTGEKIIRPCMCCRKPFPSEGKHNRLCVYCRNLDGDFL